MLGVGAGSGAPLALPGKGRAAPRVSVTSFGLRFLTSVLGRLYCRPQHLLSAGYLGLRRRQTAQGWLCSVALNRPLKLSEPRFLYG